MGVANAWFLQSLIFFFQSVFFQVKLGNYEFIKRQPVMGAGRGSVILSPQASQCCGTQGSNPCTVPVTLKHPLEHREIKTSLSVQHQEGVKLPLNSGSTHNPDDNIWRENLMVPRRWPHKMLVLLSQL